MNRCAVFGRCSGLSAALLASWFVLGCVPHVSHGPRVEPGSRYFINFAALSSPSLQDENVELMPSLFVGGTRGWTASGGGAAFSVGAQVPVLLTWGFIDRDGLDLFLATSLLDLYLQPARGSQAGGIDYGIGALLSTAVAMPYLQVGRAGDNGFYTTQALAITHGSLNTATYWIGTVALRAERPDRSRAVDFYVSGSIGNPSSSTAEQEWFVTAGIVAEFRRKRQ